MIKATDLTVLGRKLFTFYSKKEKKVDYLPKTFEESLHQDQITFTMTPSRSGGEGLWKAYRGSVSAVDLNSEKIEGQLLRQTRNLPDLVVWLRSWPATRSRAFTIPCAPRTEKKTCSEK